MTMHVPKPTHGHHTSASSAHGSSSHHSEAANAHGAHSGSLLKHKAPGDKVELSTSSLISRGGSGGAKAHGPAHDKNHPKTHGTGHGKDKSGKPIPPGLAHKPAKDLPENNPWKTALPSKAGHQPKAHHRTAGQESPMTPTTPDPVSSDPASFTMQGPTDKPPSSAFAPASTGTPVDFLPPVTLMPMAQFAQDFVNDQVTETAPASSTVEQRSTKAEKAEQVATQKATDAEQAQQAADLAAAQAQQALKALVLPGASPTAPPSKHTMEVIAQADTTKRAANAQMDQAQQAAQLATEKAGQAQSAHQASARMAFS